jgi:hypothetical protein
MLTADRRNSGAAEHCQFVVYEDLPLYHNISVSEIPGYII